MVICFTKIQAQILLELESFEVDMSYKRIKARDINEVVFATFHPKLNKSMYSALTGLDPFTNRLSHDSRSRIC